MRNPTFLVLRVSLERAIEIAVNCHRGQTDKSGKPYILHPLWLMQQFSDSETMMVAVLHDAVEDSPLTLADLEAEGFPASVVQAVDAMTRRENESYSDYIQRVQADPIARRVKQADLEHNMDLRRLNNVSAQDLKRLEKYHNTWRKLRS